jgi:hypothetical protein
MNCDTHFDLARIVLKGFFAKENMHLIKIVLSRKENGEVHTMLVILCLQIT